MLLNKTKKKSLRIGRYFGFGDITGLGSSVFGVFVTIGAEVYKEIKDFIWDIKQEQGNKKQ